MFMTESDLVLVMRVRPIDRVSQEHYESDIGQRRCYLGRHPGVEQIVWGGLTGHRMTECILCALNRPRAREVASVPRNWPVIILVEVVNFLDAGRHHFGMPAKCLMERGR